MLTLGLESCPFCEYCEVPPESAALFVCKKPDCWKTSCRRCRKFDHGKLSCEENSMKQQLANYVETKMTEALVRECPNCRKKFVKTDGCNKMVMMVLFSVISSLRVLLSRCACVVR